MVLTLPTHRDYRYTFTYTQWNKKKLLMSIFSSSRYIFATKHLIALWSFPFAFYSANQFLRFIYLLHKANATQHKQTKGSPKITSFLLLIERNVGILIENLLQTNKYRKDMKFSFFYDICLWISPDWLQRLKGQSSMWPRIQWQT